METLETGGVGGELKTGIGGGGGRADGRTGGEGDSVTRDFEYGDDGGGGGGGG